MPRVVPVKVANAYAEQMRKPDLVFVTKENEAMLAERAKELGKQLPTDQLGEKTLQEHVGEAVKEMRERKAPELKVVKTESQEPVKAEESETVKTE
jgi:hypothetical protein